MNPTERHVLSIAKAAAALGEDTCLTTIAGVAVTVHSGPHESAVTPERLKRLTRPRLAKLTRRLWTSN